MVIRNALGSYVVWFGDHDTLSWLGRHLLVRGLAELHSFGASCRVWWERLGAIFLLSTVIGWQKSRHKGMVVSLQKDFFTIPRRFANVSMHTFLYTCRFLVDCKYKWLKSNVMVPPNIWCNCEDLRTTILHICIIVYSVLFILSIRSRHAITRARGWGKLVVQGCANTGWSSDNFILLVQLFTLQIIPFKFGRCFGASIVFVFW